MLAAASMVVEVLVQRVRVFYRYVKMVVMVASRFLQVLFLVRGETRFYSGVVRGGCFVVQVPSSWCPLRCCTFQAHFHGGRHGEDDEDGVGS